MRLKTIKVPLRQNGFRKLIFQFRFSTFSFFHLNFVSRHFVFHFGSAFLFGIMDFVLGFSNLAF